MSRPIFSLKALYISIFNNRSPSAAGLDCTGLLRLCRTLSDLAKEQGIHPKTLQRIFDRYARALRAIGLRLTSLHSIQFSTALTICHVLYGAFLSERTYGTGNRRRWQYTHRKLRSAYTSLRHNADKLFVFERYPQLHIPNTTNFCDGMFAHIQERIGMHRGLSRTRRRKMADYMLERRSR